MIPQISRRCSSCGVSNREPGMFCPECGAALSPGGEEAALAETVMVSSPSPDAPIEEIVADQTVPEPVLEEKIIEEPVGARTAGTVEKTRERLHRASNVARGAIEGNVKRVEKIRHASTAVIEEASYDPSLRFVLVALGIFVVAVILLILSKVLG